MNIISPLLLKHTIFQTKRNFFANNPVYGQKIKGDITVTQISNKQAKAEFVKEVTTKKGTKDYPSYLVFENVNGEWKLILESDLISDKNAENKQKRVSEVKIVN